MANKHMALYGNTKIQREYCTKCKMYAFILNGVIQCCDSKLDISQEVTHSKRMTCPEAVRRRPSYAARKAMLELQEGKCIYCSIPFGTPFWSTRQKKILTTRVCYDHLVPFKYSQDNRDINFVCACQLCNAIKYDMIFQTIEEARLYVNKRRAQKGYEKLFDGSVS